MRDDTERPHCEFDPDALTRRFDTEIAGEVGAVAPVVDRIMDEVSSMGCATDHEFEIRLALSEAVANAVLHGCRSDPAKRVHICVECDPARGILIVVEDPGEGFDPSEVESPIEGERLFNSRGRGVFLINRLMDEVRYEKGGTLIRMRKGGACPPSGR